MKRAVGFLLLAVCAVQLGAAGLIIVGDEEFWRGSDVVKPRPPHERRIIPPPRPPSSAPIEMSFTKADVKIVDQFATTKVEQEFYNPNSRRLEGTFLFPVPKGAHIDKFTMEIDGRPAEAELLAADKARAIYEDIVRRQNDPALLEYAGQSLFKVRIFPIEPHARRKITLTYGQMLKADAGLVNFTLPLNTEKFSAKPLRTVSVRVAIEGRRELKSVYSPTHKVEVKRDGTRRATVGFEASNVRPNTDFQLFYTQDDSELGMNLLTYRRPGEDGYFLLLASPALESKKARVIPKDVVFVLDTSGSMAGAKLEQAKKALTFCIENLNDGDRFEIMRFSTEVEPLFDGWREATAAHRTRAREFVAALKPIGGTAIDDALKKALALRPEGGRPCVIIFLTDGRPTVGNVDEKQVVENATKAKSGLTRIFCFGIGTDVNTHLLDRIAEETKAFSTYVLPEEDLEVKVSSFFTKIKEPALTGPALRFPEAVRAMKIHPAPLPDLFKGEQLIVAGRYSGSGDGAIQIEGSVDGEPRKFAYDVRFAAESSEHDFIPRLWATRRVGYLLDEIRLRGESRELKEEVTELARKYGVVTPYTAYLIQEDETQRNVPLSRRTFERTRQLEQLTVTPDRFDAVMEKREGDSAVADARSFRYLKSADAPSEAITLGGAEALRTIRPGSPAGPALAARAPAESAAGLAAQARTLQEQGRFVAGKTFYQSGGKWVDSETRTSAEATRKKVPFGSTEYFALLAKAPGVKSWLAVARHVEFMLGGVVYEIVD